MFFMKMAKARENKEENKGFSLVELIIVMAIMVALVAVMAPQFIKYVQRSRDAVVSDAAENILSCVKSEIALGHITSSGTITIKTDTDGKLSTSGITSTGLQYGKGDAEYTDSTGFFYTFCGVDSNKATSTKVEYQITVDTAGVAKLAQTKDSKGVAIS